MPVVDTLPRKVLVGLSFVSDPFGPGFTISKHDRQIIEQAMWYAQRQEASLTFVHAIEELRGYDDEESERLREPYKELVCPLLEETCQKARDAGIEADFELFDGVAWHRIIQAVLQGGYELVIVGSRHSEGSFFDRFVHGTTSRRLLRKCPVPVWVVQPGFHANLQRILVPVDFSEVSRDSVDIARKLRDLTGAQLLALHCPDYPGDLAAHRMPDAPRAIESYHQQVLQKVDARFNDLLGDDRDQWKILISDRGIYRALPEAVESLDIDLVIMGSVARTGLTGFVMGNTAEKILNRLEASVWVIKPAGWSSPVQLDD